MKEHFNQFWENVPKKFKLDNDYVLVVGELYSFLPDEYMGKDVYKLEGLKPNELGLYPRIVIDSFKNPIHLL